MLFGLIRDTPVVSSEVEDPILGLYHRAGNLEKSLEAIARRNPLTILTPEQIRDYNSVVESAKTFLPTSVVLKEDAPIIESGDLPHMETFFRILHTSVVPTLHNALIADNSGDPVRGI